jgi:hypothetical protein
MATSVYFSGKVKSEQILYEDLVIESLKIFGQDVVYIPREQISHDDILNESFARFKDGYPLEMWIENVDGFEGDGSLLTKFGLEIRDQATFVVSKKRWRQTIGVHLTEAVGNDTSFYPAEGDLLYLAMTDRLFEIRYVDRKDPFFQMQDFPVYKMQCELFEYNDEEFDTGIDAIDNIETMNATSYTYSMNAGTGDYRIGETVSQWTGVNDDAGNPINIEGEVAAWEDLGLDTGNLTVVSHNTTDSKFRKFYIDPDATKVVIGTESGTSYNVQSTTIPDRTNYNRDVFSDNDAFQSEADDIIDFSEFNPFGDPT